MYDPLKAATSALRGVSYGMGDVPEINAASDALAKLEQAALGGSYNLPGSRDDLHEKVLALDAQIRGNIAKVPAAAMDSYRSFRTREEAFYQKVLNPLDYFQNRRELAALQGEYAEQVARLVPYVGPINPDGGISVATIALVAGGGLLAALVGWYLWKLLSEVNSAQRDARSAGLALVGGSRSKALARGGE